jgi:uncharacterized membrane protein YsdA (DUF1294 family)/cold shock CspA family protein
MRYAGKITNWKDDRGFGFITPVGEAKQVFLHISSFVYHRRRPVGAEVVSFEIGLDSKGREQAQNVLFAGERLPRPPAPASAQIDALCIFAIMFLLFVVGTFLFGRIPAMVPAIYAIASIIAILVYASDKSAAEEGRWRTEESTLNFIALVGGWPGALIAQRLLRHKTKKQSFQITFWIVVVLNLFVFYLLLTKSAGFRFLSL